MKSPEHVIVVGLGYVGLPLALRAVHAGFDVTGVDVSTERIARLLDASSYVEDISDGEVKEALNSGRFRVTTELDESARFDVAIIAVPTPLRDRNPDLSYVSAAAESLGNRLEPGACVVLESTTYPGTTEELLVPALEQASGLTPAVTSTSDSVPSASIRAIACGHSSRRRRSSRVSTPPRSSGSASSTAASSTTWCP